MLFDRVNIKSIPTIDAQRCLEVGILGIRSTAQGKHKHVNSHASRGASSRKLEIDIPVGWIDCDMPQHQLISKCSSTVIPLKRPYYRHISEHGDATSFSMPFSYQPTRKYDLTLPRPPPDPPAYDPYVGRSRRLQQVKASLPAWIWLVCNAALDRTASQDGRPEVSGSVLSRDSRKAAMQRAVRFARGYPPRDRTTRPSSPWILCLRNVLKGAPKLPPRRHRRRHGHYEWSGAYTERVLRALRDVLTAHVDRQAVRQYVLWEVYDAYSESLGCGIRYDPVTETWSDRAVAWLDVSGQSPAGVVQDDLRRRRPGGLRRANHNFLLSPTPSPGAKTTSGPDFSVY
ncbi:hypothetical protein GSI_02791 [Ganoderma sinense ZZ0214-1]|uniref:Uncharacterized protein n=1 Tax=Ganoderma sinense ZZ0214-1 TaxID=1077348 RepID=A0A2G8SMK6_9APHY|nr:hypothetical protein GSI_02791 [Ganoderma sinense ZZ0214-1]